MLTAYDFLTARISTRWDRHHPCGRLPGQRGPGTRDDLSVTVDDMIYHAKAVKAGREERADRRRHAVSCRTRTCLDEAVRNCAG